MPFGGLPMLILLILGVVVVLWAVRSNARRGEEYGRGGGPSGLEILQQRYARGEVNREEYLQMRHDLLSGGV